MSKKNFQKSSKTHNYIAMIVTVSVVVVILAVVSIIIAVSKDTSTGTLNQKSTAPAINSSTDKASSLAESKALLAKLESEGYTKEEIKVCEQYVDGILFRMNEITVFSSNSSSLPAANPDGNSTDDTSKYTELQLKIDRDRAAYLMIKLKKDFKSIESVFDEYLVSLQLGIDLTEYLSDKEAYEKARSDRMAGKDNTEFITTDKIENKMLENLQKQNENNRTGNLNPGSGSVTGNNSLPGLSQQGTNLPNVDIPRPVDPAEELRKKIGQ